MRGAGAVLSALSSLALASAAPAQTAAPTEPAAWSATPFALEGLAALDLDARLYLKALQVDALALGRTRLRLRAQGGALRLSAELPELFGGRAKGSVRLAPAQEGASAGARVEAALEIRELALGPLLAALGRFEWISGAANLDLAVQGVGAHPAAVIASLSGEGSFTVAQGAFRNPQTAALGAPPIPFARLGARFIIRDGVLTTSELALDGPSLTARAEGAADLRAQRLDFSVTPSWTEGEALRIEGPWAAPSLATRPAAPAPNRLSPHP